MITREMISDTITKYFLSDIIDYIPMKAKLKRRTIEGIIQRNLTPVAQRRLSLNECLNQEENNYIIERFYNVLETQLSHCDTSSFFRNIQSLTITEKPKTLRERLEEILSLKASGYYFYENNSIRIFSSHTDQNDEYVNGTKTHELIHMATTRKDGDMTLCGFERTRNRISFATGLNEAYTEIINRRYFANRGAGSYQELQPIAEEIEHLVGRKKMEQFFFSNDLNGLVDAMTKYTSREDALKLIQKMDYIYKCYGKPGEKLIQETLCRQARVDIANIRLNFFKKKFESGKISEQQFKAGLFYLELSTHNLTPFFHYQAGAKTADEAIISSTLVFAPKLAVSIGRYEELINEYYESKKDNLTYTYKPWKNKNGLGIENILIREENIQTIRRREEAKGRDPQEVNAEISQMLSENSPKIPTTETLLRKL